MSNTMIQIQDLQQNHQMTELSSAEEMMIYGGCGNDNDIEIEWGGFDFDLF